jgi:hypothetical protein
MGYMPPWLCILSKTKGSRKCRFDERNNRAYVTHEPVDTDGTTRLGQLDYIVDRIAWDRAERFKE